MTRGPRPDKRNAITEFVRQQVLCGNWTPGDQLPPRSWFLEHFQAANHTVQQAFDVLLQSGMLSADRRRGTRVSLHPPHRCRFLLLFTGAREQLYGIRRALLAAVDPLRSEDRDIVVRFENSPSEAAPSLRRQLENQEFAGVIFGNFPPLPELLAVKKIPFTGFFESPLFDVNQAPLREPGDEELVPRLARRLAAAGVRRAAVLGTGRKFDTRRGDRVRALLTANGIAAPPGYILGFHPETPEYCGNVLRLLLAGSNPQRPEGLLVLDESLLPTLAEVVAERNAVEQPTIVARGDRPELQKYRIPVQFEGCDMVRTLDGALRFLAGFHPGASLSNRPVCVFYQQP